MSLSKKRRDLIARPPANWYEWLDTGLVESYQENDYKADPVAFLAEMVASLAPDHLLGPAPKIKAEKKRKVVAHDELNEQRLARAFAVEVAPVARTIPELKQGMIWTGTHWTVCRKEEHRELASRFLEMVYSKLSANDKIEDAARLEAKRGAKMVRSLLFLAESDPVLSMTREGFDPDPWIVACRNGELDLRNGTLSPPDPKHLVTAYIDHDYNPAARCPRWIQFLGEVLPDMQLLSFVTRWTGYCLSPVVKEEALAVFTGTGRNGKGVWGETMQHVLGSGLSCSAPPGLLKARHNDPHPAELQALRNRRLVIVDEVPAASAFDEERFKMLTGGGKVMGRGMRENFGDGFIATHKLTVLCNDLPKVRDTSPAFWSRVRLVPFEVSFLGREDRSLKQKLQDEAQGILAWAVQACILWQREGLGAPARVREATSAYRQSQDVLGEWSLTIGEVIDVPAAELHDRYRSWAAREGQPPMTATALGRALGKLSAWTKRNAKSGIVWSFNRPSEDLAFEQESSQPIGFIDDPDEN